MKTSARHGLRACLVLVALLLAPAAAAFDTTAAPRQKTISVAGMSYQHRWSSATQHEYTPDGQEDLKRWTEMITFVDVPGMRSGAQIAQYRDMLRTASAKNGAVLGAQCTPASGAPTECWVSTALRGEGFVETTLSRIALVGGRGVVAIFAHREYGPAAADQSTAWLRSAAGGKANAAWLVWPLKNRPR